MGKTGGASVLAHQTCLRAFWDPRGTFVYGAGSSAGSGKFNALGRRSNQRLRYAESRRKARAQARGGKGNQPAARNNFIRPHEASETCRAS